MYRSFIVLHSLSIARKTTNIYFKRILHCEQINLFSAATTERDNTKALLESRSFSAKVRLTAGQTTYTCFCSRGVSFDLFLCGVGVGWVTGKLGQCKNFSPTDEQGRCFSSPKVAHETQSLSNRIPPPPLSCFGCCRKGCFKIFLPHPPTPPSKLSWSP